LDEDKKQLHEYEPEFVRNLKGLAENEHEFQLSKKRLAAAEFAIQLSEKTLTENKCSMAGSRLETRQI
jgi:hypothetical protein